MNFAQITRAAFKFHDKLEYKFGSPVSRIQREIATIHKYKLEQEFERLLNDDCSIDNNDSNSAILYILGVCGKAPRGEFMPIVDVYSDRLAPIDIDIDVSGIKRREVIDYLHSKMQAYPILAFSTLNEKSAIKDLGKALGFPYSMMDAITKAIEEDTPSKLLDAVVYKHPMFLEEVKKLEGAIRHCTIHASGLAVFDGSPQDNYLALRRAPRTGEVVVDVDGQTLEALGIIKVDILGSLTTDVIADAEKEAGIKVPPIEEIIHDPRIIEAFQNCDVSAIFQAGGNTNKRVFQQVKPSNFNEVVDCISLARPGTKEQLDAYCSYSPNIDDERVVDLLKSTRGVLLYQEQVLLIAREIGNLTGAEAEILRRGIGKKKDESFIAPVKNKFIENATDKLGEEMANLLWETMAKHIGYSFNKSHAVAYAAQSFKQMYLKIYHPTEFWCHTLKNCKEDEKYEYRYEIAKSGIILRKPSIKTYVEDTCVTSEYVIQLSPRTIKGVDKFPDNLNPEKLARCEDIYSAVRLMSSVSNKTMLLLCKAGFFDELEPNRDLVESAINGGGQISLFEIAPAKVKAINKYEEEKDLFGMWIENHPLRIVDSTSKLLDINLYGGNEAIGIVDSFKTITNAKGKRMAFMTLGDDTFYIDCVIFSTVLDKMDYVPCVGEIVIVRGNKWGQSFTVESIERC